MKTINGTNYYTKQDIATDMGVTVATVNKRIKATGIRGFFFGHTIHYTDDQRSAIVSYRPGVPAETATL